MAILSKFGGWFDRGEVVRSNDFAQGVSFPGIEGAAFRSGGEVEPTQVAPELTQMSFASASSVATSAMKNGPLAKLDTQLAALYYSSSDRATAMSAFTSSVTQFANAVTADGKYVLVDATAKDGNGAALLTQLDALGARGASSYGAVASGWVPTSSIAALAATSNLAFARESAFTVSTGTVTTQADHAEAADTARSTYNVTGAGLRVGVISDSFNADSARGGSDTMATDIASDDLPTDTNILQDYSSGEDEGRGMAQLIHDLAPGASIDFASGESGQAGFANNIVALANAGDKIIVDDLLYFAEPSYQNGVISQAVNKVAAQGVTYLSAAGNDGHQGYEGAWVNGATMTLSGHSYTLMNFASGQDYLTVTDPYAAYFNLQWDSPAASAGGAGSQNDLDLFLVDPSGNVVASATSNNINGDPIETLYAGGADASGTYKLYVGLASGVAPGDIRIVALGNGSSVTLGDPASNTNTGTLYGHAAADGAIAVGAASFADTPAAGVNPPVSEYYSSRGVDHILFADDGTRLAKPHDGVVALTGVDGGNTTFFGYDSSDDSDSLPNFYGTSAAAPDVAAVAALMLEARSTLTPTDIRNLLQDSAIPMADAATSGSGLIQADKAVGFAETLTIANSQQTTLEGTHLGDTITGTNGDDTIDGGAGADTMTGGSGNDTYYVDNVGDNVVEASSGGTDQIFSSVSYSLLGRYIETLTLTGSAAINATGNAAVNALVGNSGNNVLDGGAGADTMTGGLGNDTYYVDNAGDNVVELASGGTDQIFSSVSYSLLGRYIETLTLTGSAAINATGNAAANTLVGNAGNNVLTGGGGIDTASFANATGAVTASLASGTATGFGSDTLSGITNLTGSKYGDTLTGNSSNNVLDGGAGADTMTGGSGNDTYYVDNAGDNVVELASGGTDQIFSSVSYSLLGRYIETLTLTGSAAINATGNAAVNALVGNSGNNVLDGGAGADTMTGGLGNDTYYVDNAGDNVVEAAGGGTDQIFSSVSYSLLGRYIETLTLTGSAALNATGNAAANALIGNSGGNVLDGGLGNDTLTGGSAADIFLFDTALGATNVDSITDFTLGTDLIALDKSIFAAAGADGTLASAAFGSGTTATTSSQRILYDSSTGDIYYDKDGTGSSTAVKFAHVTAGLALTASAFSIQG